MNAYSFAAPFYPALAPHTLSCEKVHNAACDVDNFVDKWIAYSFLHFFTHILSKKTRRSLMFKVVKFNTVLLIAAAVVLAIAITPAFFLAERLSAARTFSQAERRRIVIDAGHGGEDPGVTGVATGVKESDLNLKVALTLGDLLSSAGFKTVQTRVSEGALVTGKYSKSKDMEARKKTIERADPQAVVSIHMNKYPEDKNRRGIQIFYSTEASAAFAEELQKHLDQTMNEPTLGRGFDPICGDYYIAKCAACPSVIVECAFLSNPSDENLISDANYRLRLAIEIKNAIESYFSGERG